MALSYRLPYEEQIRVVNELILLNKLKRKENQTKTKMKELEYYFILRFIPAKGNKLWQHTKRWQQNPLSVVLFITFFF